MTDPKNGIINKYIYQKEIIIINTTNKDDTIYKKLSSTWYIVHDLSTNNHLKNRGNRTTISKKSNKNTDRTYGLFGLSNIKTSWN